MKPFCKCMIVVSLGAVVVLCASWSAHPPKADKTDAGVLFVEPSKALVLQPTYKIIPALNEVSTSCLSCHGPTYEDLRAKTVNFVYNGEKLQPHAYLDMNKREAHDTKNGMDCLQCHAAHDLPAPKSAVRKAKLDFCINCHHTGEIIACADCHGSTP